MRSFALPSARLPDVAKVRRAPGAACRFYHHNEFGDSLNREIRISEGSRIFWRVEETAKAERLCSDASPLFKKSETTGAQVSVGFVQLWDRGDECDCGVATAG